MRLKKLRVAAAIIAAAAIVPIVTPAQARVQLTECERRAWEYCKGVASTDIEQAICYDNTERELCPPKPGFPITW